MKVLITGTSNGIGLAAANKFLNEGHEVIGLDIDVSKITHKNYKHIICDIRNDLPKIEGIEILVNNAGVQNQDDIEVNLVSTIKVTRAYGFGPDIKSVLFNASVSGVSGDEFPEYAASKAGQIGYMKNCAKLLARKGATCNALCLGGVSTELNKPVMNDEDCWKRIMKVTPLSRWCTPEEAADWIYFLTVTQRFCTGQSIVVDGGEKDCRSTFVWKI